MVKYEYVMLLYTMAHHAITKNERWVYMLNPLKDVFNVLVETKATLWLEGRGGYICYLNFLPTPPQTERTLRRTCWWLPGTNRAAILSTEAFSYSGQY